MTLPLARDLLLAMETEDQFQAWLVGAAEAVGWSWHHETDSRRTRAGWPDLVLWRPRDFLIAELKTERGRVSPEQHKVIAGLAAAGIEVHVWRPRDRPEIRRRLGLTTR